MHGGVPLRGRRVGVILSGGNVDLARFCALAGQSDSGGVPDR
jgi:threonine dehydratase